MAKLVLLLVAAIAVQGIFADTQEWQLHQTRMMKRQRTLQKVAEDAEKAIEEVQTDDKGIRMLKTQANDFAYDVEEVVYHLQRITQRTQGEEAKTLQQVVSKLSEVVYKTQQTINAEPSKMKKDLKEQVRKVAEEAQKINEYVQETEEPQKWETMREMKRSMMDIHLTVRKMKVFAENYDKTVDEINTMVQAVLAEMPTYIQKIQNDETSAKEMTLTVQQLAHKMNRMVDILEREADNQEGETKTKLQDVAKKVGEMRTKLEEKANTRKNPQDKAKDLKEEVDKTMKDMATEARKLVEAARNKDEGLKRVVRATLMNIMAHAKTIQAQMDIMTEN